MDNIMLNQWVEEITSKILELKKEEKSWDNFISGFSSEAFNISRQIKMFERLIDLEKKNFLKEQKFEMIK